MPSLPVPQHEYALVISASTQTFPRPYQCSSGNEAFLVPDPWQTSLRLVSNLPAAEKVEYCSSYKERLLVSFASGVTAKIIRYF